MAPATGKKLVLAPAARRRAPINFQRSVVEGVQLSQLSALSASAQEAARRHAGDGVVRMWGSLANKRAEWERVRAGDWVLFYTGKRFAALARVASKRRDATMADAVWEPVPASWENIMFLRDMRPIDVPVPRVAALLGYDPGWNGPREFFIPASSRQQHALASYADLSALIVSLSADSSLQAGSDVGESYADIVGGSPEELHKFLERLRARSKGMRPKAKRTIVERIERDAQVVKELKDLYNGHCQVCDDTFAMVSTAKNYCEGAHIVPISSRLPGIDSYLNIAILCATCHKKLDHGGMRIYWDDQQQQMLCQWQGQSKPLARNEHMRTGWVPAPAP
ncbi:MAG TPA: HNH endonuclease [Solirubrobacteraceae bacterium]|nr:HNH endonuclease [Solirubrobacteraceae bacterium]